MITAPFFSLVIVNYRSASHLQEALQSVLAQETDPSTFEVIVVNNDPQEQEKVEDLQREFPQLRIFHTSENKGFGAGANLGAQKAVGSVLGILNPDLIWKRALLTEVRDFFYREARMGVAGLQLLTEEGRPELWSSGKEPTLFQILRNNVWPRRETGRTNKTTSLQEKDWVSGGAFFIRTELFQALGGFDENFFLYFEDVDLCRRVREAEYQVVHLPGLAVYHKGGKSHSSLRKQKRYFYQSQSYYFQKHFSRTAYFFLRFFRFFRHGS